MAKTIFRSSEKSNFILNMTEEQYSKLASRGLIIAIMSVMLFTVVSEVMYELAYKSSYALSAAGLAVGGVICIVLALIAIMKKYIPKAAILPVCCMAVLVGWGVVSLINGYDLNVSMYGYPNRGEGLLAILFYFGFFTTAAAIKRETAVKALIKGIVAVGVVNSALSLVQVFACKLTHYEDVYVGVHVNAASGLSMSPIFLAMILTLALTAALVGFVTSSDGRSRIVYICASALFSFVMMFTYTIIGVCGLAFSALAAVIAVFAMKAPKTRLLSVFAAAVPAAIAVVIVNAGIVGNLSSYKFYDGRLAWWSDGYMRASASGDFNPDVVEIDDPVFVYTYMNEKTMNVIEKNPLTGTGPEQLAFAQLRSTGGLTELEDIFSSPSNEGNRNVFDKNYNEYLYTAATRGIPSAIALCLALISALIIGYKSFRSKKSTETFTVFVLTLGGVLMFFISNSSITYAPIFWAVAGAACASASAVKEKKAVAKSSEKADKTEKAEKKEKAEKNSKNKKK